MAVGKFFWNKKVLLLGGAGFIGYNIARYLSENRNYELTIADNFFRAGGVIDETLKKFIDKHQIELKSGDYTDPKAFNFLISRANFLLLVVTIPPSAVVICLTG